MVDLVLFHLEPRLVPHCSFLQAIDKPDSRLDQPTLASSAYALCIIVEQFVELESLDADSRIDFLKVVNHDQNQRSHLFALHPYHLYHRYLPAADSTALRRGVSYRLKCQDSLRNHLHYDSMQRLQRCISSCSPYH
jgi:hypothetical protein